MATLIIPYKVLDGTVVWETHLVTWKPPAVVDPTVDQAISRAVQNHEPLVMGGSCGLFDTSSENFGILTKGQPMPSEKRS